MKKFSKYINEEYGDNKFKLSLDIHGVIDSVPKTFSFITESIVKNGGEIHILTGAHWGEEIEKFLKDNKIHWTHKFSIYDHLMEVGAPVIGEVVFDDKTKQMKFENDRWDKIKGEYCFNNKINLHMDDSILYNEYFKTPFARVWTHSGTPKLPSKDIRQIP